ncbi:MAG: LacI family DNA-binding transcriptional regulator [Lachnospiraceae bacterium]
MITMTEIAKLAGVSQATVSRVLSGNGSVNSQARQKVLQCAKEHDYQPNIIAQSLVGNKTFLLGVVVTDISNPFFADLVKAIEQEASEQGYSIMLFNTDYDKAKEEKYLRILKQYKADGVLLVPITEEEDYVEQLKRYDIPIVSVTLDLKTIDSVFISHYQAGRKVAQHMLGMGFESFIFAGGEPDQKEMGFKDELEKNEMDLTNHYMAIRLNAKDEMKHQLAQRLEEEKDTDGVGIFAFNDMQALKILEILRELKKKVPEEVAVAGFDNTFLGKVISPTLTSVAQPIEEMGRLSVERMIELISKKQEKCVRYQLETRLITRESTIKKTREIT